MTPAPRQPLTPQDAVAHLTPDRWEHANRLLIRKALAEFSHERLLTPKPVADDEPAGGTERADDARPAAEAGRRTYTVRSDDGTTTYRFRARLMSLEHWQVDADSVTRHRGGEQLPLDALAFVTELRGTLGLGEDMLPVYLEEISSTLSGTAYKLSAPPVGAAELARSGFQQIESGMTEGHPCFVANNGRLGFDIAEYHAYAPETGAPVRLVWIAAHRAHATFSFAADLSYDKLLLSELSAATLRRFSAALTEQGLDPDDYYLMPVHPWQWWHKLSVTFAAEVARRRLVCLGHGDDEHVPQQSIRTFFNSTHPDRHYVKTALSVVNMGFLRGLSASYMEATPAINDWLADLVARDEVLQETGLAVLRECAAVGYHPAPYEAAAKKGSPYLKMLAALWRESPMPLLEPGQRPATMASLLHVDWEGDSFAAALIRQSGLHPATWLRRYLDAYLTPLLHSFYAYDLVFMPHGENVILVLDENGVPQRALFKDLAEEIAVMSEDAELPPEVERIRADVPEDMKLLSLFTDVFDCFLRFLNAALADRGVMDEDTFWSTVADCVSDYQKSAPHLADRFRRYDLFTGEFALSCLNRLQLRDNQQMVDLQDPSGALQLVGNLENPIARFTR